MELILTHENADFDAVASQLATYKLNPDARPVVPRRMNRNVRHFLALYWDELPYIRFDDVPREPIDSIVLVDTQSFQTLRGAGPHTRVRVIDHHTPPETLDAAWQVVLDSVGAATTLLCEQLQEQHIAITGLEATLLLLGVYEDTGSLTYGTTTPRDARVAAWLLERGASLDTVSRFLHHPLSEDQRALYERLLDSTETLEVEGYSIVVACAEAHDLEEEVSTLAHKLRDLLEPSALFLLVDLGPHIQLVARSTIDDINVAEVARCFDGGGHGRAAAAIIRGSTLAQARQALLAHLPDAVHPGLTVADLMSHGVQILDPSTRVRDADEAMRRYGYEGYPVVREDGRIVGLLTRRAVDRAMGHGLSGVRIEQLMEAGEIFVTPSDSMARLQHVMMTSGWGQIPVVDDDGAIIGVATRTDLIQHIGHPAPNQSQRADVVHRLEATLPPALMALVREAGRIAHDMNANLYVVGGFVRDLLLDQPTSDLDFVVEGDAIALTQRLCERYDGEMRSHQQFGTGKWLLAPAAWRAIADELKIPLGENPLPPHLDFATARTEFYRAPTALPEVERGSIKLDLHRRDFTLNTLAIQLDPHHFGQLLDFYGGLDDLHEKRIRVLHSLSFVDDPTRILRAVRLEQRLGFRIEPRTEELITHALPMIERVSGDRIRHEIETIFQEAEPECMFHRLQNIGALQAIHPELRFDDWLAEAFQAVREGSGRPLWPELAREPDLCFPYLALLMYRLTRPVVRSIGQRLRVRRDDAEDIDIAHDMRPALEELVFPVRPSHLDEWLSPANDRVLLTLWAAAPGEAHREHIVDYATRLRHITPHTDGEALKTRGLEPGPVFGRILRALRAAWLDGEISTAEEEKALLERLLAGEQDEASSAV
jgi:tRNA nucleotidyltransferase (CCA-adding enzyme)